MKWVVEKTEFFETIDRRKYRLYNLVSSDNSIILSKSDEGYLQIIADAHNNNLKEDE